MKEKIIYKQLVEKKLKEQLKSAINKLMHSYNNFTVVLNTSKKISTKFLIGIVFI